MEEQVGPEKNGSLDDTSRFDRRKVKKIIFSAAILVPVLSLAFLVNRNYFGADTTKKSAENKTEVNQVNKSTKIKQNRLLIKFHSEVKEENKKALLDKYNLKEKNEIKAIGVKVVDLPEDADSEAYAEAFNAQREVEFAELDERVSPDLTPNDPSYSGQWHLPKIQAPTAWDKTTGLDSVIIAILDTGVDPSHTDLASKMVAGWNTYDNNNNTADVYGHGTAVAGTAAAISNNSTGVAALAWQPKIMPVRISDTAGYGYSSTIANGLTWSADNGARVANISYRVSTNATVKAAAQYFQSKGGVVASSAGNETTFDSSPDNPYVLTVGATDSADNLASWSNTGNNIDVVAPGVSISTTNRGGGYGSWSGTSFSSPVTASVAALVMSAKQSLTPNQVQDIIKQSADDKGVSGWDTTYGWGRVNASRAIDIALGTVPIADVTAPSVSFLQPANGTTVSGTTVIRTTANDNIGVAETSLAIDGSIYLTPSSSQIGSDNTITYSYSLDTTTLADATHTLVFVAKDAAGNAANQSIQITTNNTVAVDTTAPVVSIISPADGSTLASKTAVSISASDNSGVKRVEFYVDGVLQKSFRSAPYNFSWSTTKVKTGNHTLSAKAYDAAGNVATSTSITFSK